MHMVRPFLDSVVKVYHPTLTYPRKRNVAVMPQFTQEGRIMVYVWVNELLIHDRRQRYHEICNPVQKQVFAYLLVTSQRSRMTNRYIERSFHRLFFPSTMLFTTHRLLVHTFFISHHPHPETSETPETCSPPSQSKSPQPDLLGYQI